MECEYRTVRISAANARLGPYPPNDGWRWVYRLYASFIEPSPALRRVVRAYFWPKRLEEVGNGRLYELLGVRWFGRLIPTGGVLARRWTGSRMAPYTLSGTSLGAARAFFFRTCIFEMLHLPFLSALAALTVHRLWIGRSDLAFENLAVNLAFNIYPIMHHRHTRVRILRLMRLHEERSARRVRTAKKTAAHGPFAVPDGKQG